VLRCSAASLSCASEKERIMASSKQTMKKVLPIGLAVTAGALLLYFTTKKANAGQLPPPPDPGGGEDPGGGGNNSGGGGGGSNINAPAWPGQRTAQENGFIDGSYSEWIAALGVAMDNAGSSGPATMDHMRAAKAQLGIPSNQTPSQFYADAGLAYVYGFDGRIPSGANNTWTPYINAWRRMQQRFASRPLDPTSP
jgi:hypothetical protein